MGDKQVIRDIPYTQTGQKLDIYLPSERRGTLPLIVWIHGGAWKQGDKAEIVNSRWGDPSGLVSEGYILASINYRLSQEAIFPAQIHDCKAAIRWLRAHAGEYGIDSEKIGIGGGSAGGHLAALLGTSDGVGQLEGDGGNLQYSSSVRAVCDMFGPVDLLRMSEMLGEIDKESNESRLVGGPLRQNVDKVIQANPITYIHKNAPPFLIFHGANDKLVPSDQSQILYQALLKANIEAALHIVPGGGHGFVGAEVEELGKIYGMVVNFFDKHLK